MNYLSLGVRLFAIASLLYSLEAFGLFFQYYIDENQYNAKPSLVVVLANFIVPLLLAVFMWLSPRTITKKLLGNDIYQPNSIQTESLLSIIIIGIGLFTFYYAFVDTWYWIIFYNAISSSSQIPTVILLPEQKASIWITGIQIAISAVLILKSKTIAKWLLNKAR